MSLLHKIAFYQNRRDEIPNQAVAHELAQTRNASDIQEIAQNLWNKEPNIQSDCLKVLYELGYLAPVLIADYAQDFLKLLKHRNNRMVWGGMIALSTIAGLQASQIFPYMDEIVKTMESGSVITNDAGIKTLSALAGSHDLYRRQIVPYLLKRLADARPVDAPRYAETILPSIGREDRAEFIYILDKWIDQAGNARLSRLKRVRRLAEESPDRMIALYTGLLLLLVAFVLFFIAGRQQRASGLPGGRVIYTDTRAWGKLEKPLYDRELGLTGKPDYLVEQKGQIIPVEVKTGRTPEAPYDSHIFQLAVYCLLVHKTYHKRPSHGILHYPNRDFAVDYTPEMENALLDLIAEMRIDERRLEIQRSHADPQRCRHCGFRQVCDQRLA